MRLPAALVMALLAGCTTPATGPEAADAAPDPGLPLELPLEWTANATLGLTGFRDLAVSHYYAFPVLGQDGFSSNCLQAEAPGRIESLHLSAAWDPQGGTVEKLRFVLIVPGQGWVWDNETRSPLQAALDPALLKGSATFQVAVHYVRGAPAIAVGQEVDVGVRVTTWEAGDLDTFRPSCAASE